VALDAGRFAAVHESAFGTKRTYQSYRSMSAFGGKADISQRLFTLVSNSNFSNSRVVRRGPKLWGASFKLSAGRARDLAIRRSLQPPGFHYEKHSGSPGARAIRRGADVDHRRNRPETLFVATSLTIASC